MYNNNEIKPSELNRRITARAYSYTQGAAGGLVPSLVESFDTWAKVIQKGGSVNPAEGQQMISEQYELTIRYRSSLNENWIFVYEGLALKVNQMQVDNPAYKRYLIINCSVTSKLSSWS